jgi:hypothetical protein
LGHDHFGALLVQEYQSLKKGQRERSAFAAFGRKGPENADAKACTIDG